MNWNEFQTLSMLALMVIGGFIAINMLVDYTKGKWNERTKKSGRAAN